MNKLSKTTIWQKLLKHKESMATVKMRELFQQDEKRFAKFSLNAAGIFLDYSKNIISEETIKLLAELAKELHVETMRDKMFSGEKINITENRAVLHTALRNPNQQGIFVDGQDVLTEVHSTLNKMQKLTEEIREGKWKGFSGLPITDVVNIGIGGSDLGPHMAITALTPYVINSIHFHFVSNVDGTQISETLKELNPETTLFIVASKTFTTQETLANFNTAKEWLEQKASKEKKIDQHFIAVTANPEKAMLYGIKENNVYPFWDWVGGRYSLWSAIGLAIAIAIGMDNFLEFLAGAYELDQHFRSAPIAENLPIILALIGIWNINFFNTKSQAILPYDQSLELFPSYLQQLEMESNGKSVNINGEPIEWATSPIIWGSVGTNGQHAFHQLLMQGTQMVPVDFILPLKSQNPIGQHHLLLAANCFAQSQAFMQGKTEEQIIKELEAQGLDVEAAKKLAPHKVIAGNTPSNTILLEKLTPKTLGSLIALYEHKVFVQGVIWQINSFDQWGVELGKQLSKKIIVALENGENAQQLDASTAGLIAQWQKK